MSDLVCSDPRHPLRNAEADWSGSLGTTTGPGTGMLCTACDRLRKIEAIDSADQPVMEIRRDGSYSVQIERTYQPEGITVETKIRNQTVQNFVAAYPGFTTNAQRQAYRDALIAMAHYARTNPL